MNLRDAVVAALCDVADPARAPGQQAYMKSAMPFCGASVPQCRRIASAVLETHPPDGALAWEAAILGLWRGAVHREERYVAVELLLHRRCSGWLEPARVPMIEELVVTGAWWDHVDPIAARGMGPLLAAHPRPARALLRGWAKDGNIWKRRTAILAQLRCGRATDKALLADTIRPSIGESEFFLRKAIGWALRAFSRSDPAWVAGFVESHAGLSDLSRREALKHLARARPPAAPGGRSGRAG